MERDEWVQLGEEMEPYIRALGRIAMKHKLDDYISINIRGAFTGEDWAAYIDTDGASRRNVYEYEYKTGNETTAKLNGRDYFIKG